MLELLGREELTMLAESYGIYPEASRTIKDIVDELECEMETELDL